MNIDDYNDGVPVEIQPGEPEPETNGMKPSLSLVNAQVVVTANGYLVQGPSEATGHMVAHAFETLDGLLNHLEDHLKVPVEHLIEEPKH